MGVVGPRVHKREQRRGTGNPKLETERDGSVSGCIGVLRSRGGFCGVTDPPAMVICEGGDLGVSWYGGGR